MKKSIIFSLIILLVLSVSPLLAGGGPPSRTEATRPVGTTPDDTNEGGSWDDPERIPQIDLGLDELSTEVEQEADFVNSIFLRLKSFSLSDEISLKHSKKALNQNGKFIR